MSDVARDAETDVGNEAVLRLRNDAVFHAIVQIAVVMTEHDVETHFQRKITSDERSIIKRSAAVGIILYERKLAVDAEKL